MLDAAHLDQLREHGGLPGIRDEHALEAAFLAAMIFLGLNGKDLDATEVEVVQVVTALAAGSLTEEALATWLRERLVRLKL